MIPNINLLPKLEQQKQVPVWIYVAVISVITLVLAFFVYAFFMAKSEVQKLSIEKQQLTVVQSEAQTKLAGIQALYQGGLGDTVEMVEAISYQVTPLMTEVTQQLPSNSYLRNYQFGEEGVVITVDFETLSSISTFLEKIKTSQYFTDSKMDSIANFEVNGATGEELTGNKFTVVPRYTTTITLTINKNYLATLGGEQ